MTAHIPPIVGKLIPRLASHFNAEVVETARAIERTLKSAKLDWHDLAGAVAAVGTLPEPIRRTISESDEAARMRVWLEAISREPWLNDWTQKFLASVLARPSLDRLSEKQTACANNIIAEAYRRGVRADRSAAAA